MLAGAPYILAPGGDGVLGGATAASTGGLFGSMFGYGNLTPAIMVMQALLMPMLSLIDTGLPILWREVASRWWYGSRPSSKETYQPLHDDPLAA